MRAWGRTVVVSCATATALMAVDGCARSQPSAAADAIVLPAAGPYDHGPGSGAYDRRWSGPAWNGQRAPRGDGWWPPQFAPSWQRPRTTRPYWVGPRWQAPAQPYAWGNRNWQYPGQAYGGRAYGNGYGRPRPYANRQYQRPDGYADWQWAQRY